MKYTRKTLLFKQLFILSLITIVLSISSITIYFLYTKSTASKNEFENFMDAYKIGESQTFDNLNNEYKIANIKEIIHKQKLSAKTQTEIEILDTFQELINSISFEIISSKTIFNKSKLNINFSYYDLSRHIINYFKNSENISHEDFLKSLKSKKYKTYANLDVFLNKKNGKWIIILSEKLLNILSGGLYKNFSI